MDLTFRCLSLHFQTWSTRVWPFWLGSEHKYRCRQKTANFMLRKKPKLLSNSAKNCQTRKEPIFETTVLQNLQPPVCSKTLTSCTTKVYICGIRRRRTYVYLSSLRRCRILQCLDSSRILCLRNLSILWTSQWVIMATTINTCVWSKPSEKRLGNPTTADILALSAQCLKSGHARSQLADQLYLVTRVEESDVFGWSRISNNTGSRIFCPTPDVQLDHFLCHTLNLGVPVEMVQFLLKLLLNRGFLAVHHDFHWF